MHSVQPIQLVRLLEVKYAFYWYYGDFEKFKRMSIGSKHGELKQIYKLLSDFKNLKRITTKTKNCKNRILNNVNQLYSEYFDTDKKKIQW